MIRVRSSQDGKEERRGEGGQGKENLRESEEGSEGRREVVVLGRVSREIENAAHGKNSPKRRAGAAV